MPPQGKEHGDDAQEGRDGSEECAHLNGLTRGDHIGGKVLEHIFKLVCARCSIIRSAGLIRNFPEGHFIDFPAEAATPTALSELRAKV